MRRAAISEISSDHDRLWGTSEDRRMRINDRVEIEECLSRVLTVSISGIDEWDTSTSVCLEDITLLTRAEGDDVCK